MSDNARRPIDLPAMPDRWWLLTGSTLEKRTVLLEYGQSCYEAGQKKSLDELRYIAEAKRFDREKFDDDSSFADWAQSRARTAVSRRIP